MIIRAKAWLWFFVATLILSAGRSEAATNEYYTSPKAKAVIDGLISSYGGAEKMKAIDRVKVVMQITSQNRTIRATFYQTATKMRRDVAQVNLVEIYDGKEMIATVNGKRVPPKPESKDELANELKEGVFQAALLDVLMNKDRHVVYRGEKSFDGKKYDVLETANYKNEMREHYIDPESHREIVRMRHKPTGIETSINEAFDEFKGVLFEKRTILKRVDGSVAGGMRVVEISSDFDDSVFDLPQ
jgi:hypothetical protein